MINSLIIRNLQSHKDSEFELSPRVNAIIGLTDSGKSAIIRAFKWLTRNEPLGESIRSTWGGDTLVRAVMGHNIVERLRGKEFNGYIINRKLKLEVITPIPEEVTKILNIGEFNLQQQLDAPFMISNTAGGVAKMLNRIAGLDKIDLSSSNINSWISQINTSIKTKQEDLKKKNDELSKYDYLVEFEKEVERLEALQKKLDDICAAAGELQIIINDLIETTNEIEEYKSLLSIEKDIDEILRKIEKKNTLTNDYTRLYSLIESLQEDNQKIESYKTILTYENKIEECLQLCNDKEDLYYLMVGIMEYSIRIDSTKTKYKTLHEQFEKEMGETCILCGQKIKQL